MNVAKVQNLVIANGATTSQWIWANKEYGDAHVIILYTPTGAALGTCTIECTYIESGTPTAGQIFTFQVAGADAAPPAAGKAIAYEYLAGTRGFRLKATVGVTGDQTVYVTKHFPE